MDCGCKERHRSPAPPRQRARPPPPRSTIATQRDHAKTAAVVEATAAGRVSAGQSAKAWVFALSAILGGRWLSKTHEPLRSAALSFNNFAGAAWLRLRRMNCDISSSRSRGGTPHLSARGFDGFADSFFWVVWAGSCARDGRPEGRDLGLGLQQPGRRRSRRRAQTRAKQTHRVQQPLMRDARAGGRESGRATRRQSIGNGSGANARLKSVPSRSMAQATFSSLSATERSARA